MADDMLNNSAGEEDDQGEMQQDQYDSDEGSLDVGIQFNLVMLFCKLNAQTWGGDTDDDDDFQVQSDEDGNDLNVSFFCVYTL